MHKYMSYNDPNAFLDWPMQKPAPGFEKLCTRCQGHGGWNLAINQYMMPSGYENTPENRHRYTHFRKICDNCNGWGYVHNNQACPGHEWQFAKNLGRCYNQYQCIHCQAVQNVDSGD